LAEAIEIGTTRLEMAAALPHRSWEAIRKKIAQVHGKGIKVPETGFLAPSDTILDYLEAHPEAAGAMPFAILENYSRQIPQNKKHHCSGCSNARFNVAALMMNAVSVAEFIGMPALSSSHTYKSSMG